MPIPSCLEKDSILGQDYKGKFKKTMEVIRKCVYNLITIVVAFTCGSWSPTYTYI